MSRLMKNAIVWFRNTGLRLHDNEALSFAHLPSTAHGAVFHLYVFDPSHYGKADFSKSLVQTNLPKCGGFRTQFIVESVQDLRRNIEKASCGEDGKYRNTLIVRIGDPAVVLASLVKEFDVSHVYCSSPESIEEKETHNKVAEACKRNDCIVRDFWSNTLYHVSDLPFDPSPNARFPRTASEFRKGVERDSTVRKPIPVPKRFIPLPSNISTDSFDNGEIPTASQLLLLGGHNEDTAVMGVGTVKKHDERATLQFVGGETAALARLQEYFWDKDLLRKYKTTRNGMIGADYSSKFSPWLAHGCLSPRLVHQEVRRYERERVKNRDVYWMLFELIFRDYFRFYCFHHGSSVFKLHGPKAKVNGNNHSPKTWNQNLAKFETWCKGRTGNIMVDANMRELALTGFMSNRGRQIVASYLTRDMGLDWRLGAMWFESALIDHDPCQNWGNWTYAAGVGSDPREDRYFSIPKQTQNYDPQHEFIKLWVPEVSHLSPAERKRRLTIGCRSRGSLKKFGGPKQAWGKNDNRQGKNGRKSKKSKQKKRRLQSSMYNFVTTT